MTTDMISYDMGGLARLVFFVAYGLIVVFCVAETTLEIVRSGASWDRWKFLGLALSVAWPMLLMLLIFPRFFKLGSDRRATVLRETVD